MAKMGAPYGIRHGRATVPDSTVREIKDRFYDQSETVKAMAAEYGIPEYTIRDWVSFKTRVHT